MNKEQGWPAPEEDRTGEGAGRNSGPVPPSQSYGGGPGFAPPGGRDGQIPAGYSVPDGSAGPGGFGQGQGPGGFGQGQGQGPGPWPGGPAGYGGGPSHGNQPKKPGTGLAIAALCVAGIGLLFSWIWFLNFIAYLAGAVALGLGIPALVRGIKAKSAALPLAITAVSSAVLSIIVATIINVTVQYGSLEAETGSSQGEAVPGPLLTEAPAPAPSGAPSEVPGGDQKTEPAEQPGLPDRDYSADISGSFYTDIIEQPAASAGEGVQVGDYMVTLAEVDRDATAEVLQRDPSAGEPTHGYVLFEFRAVYNGSATGGAGGTGRPDLDFTPKFIGADERLHSVLNCSMDLGVSSSDRPRLAPGETGTYEICFDLPEAALAEDSRVGLRMILAERNEDVYWRLP